MAKYVHATVLWPAGLPLRVHTLHIALGDCVVFLCAGALRVLCVNRPEPLCVVPPLCVLPPLPLVLYCACELKCVRSVL